MATQIDDELIQSLEALYGRFVQLQNATGSSDAALRNLINTTNKLSDAEKNAALATLQNVRAMERQQAARQRVEAGFRILQTTVSTVTQNMGALATGILGARDAFTAVSPAISGAANFISGVAQAAIQLGTGFSIFGTSISKTGEALGKFAGIALDTAARLVNESLRLAQTVTNNFTKIGESGVIFAASLDGMIRSASSAGLTIDRFVEFVSKNNQVLSGLAGNIGQNAVNLMNMGKRIGETNRALLVSYGSYEALNDGIAEFIGLQQQLGFVDLRNQQQLTQGAQDYLVRTRELTSLTGKRADQLREEERQRRQELDYALKVSRLSVEQQENLRAAMGIAGRFGPEAEAYIKEYFATGGQVVSEQALRFQAMQEPVAKTLRETLIGAVDLDATAFRQNTARVLSENAPALKAFAESLESLAEINRAAMNPIITSMSTTGAGILQNMNLLQDATALFRELGQAADQLKRGAPDEKMAAAANAIDQLITNQRALDELSAASITRMEDYLKFGYYFQNKMLQLTEGASALLGAVTGNASAAEIAAAAQKFLGLVGEPTDREVPNTSSGPVQNQAGMQRRALGGIANEPVIAGEAGPEAIIPLAHGNVPLDINWSPMLKSINDLSLNQTRVPLDIDWSPMLESINDLSLNQTRVPLDIDWSPMLKSINELVTSVKENNSLSQQINNQNQDSTASKNIDWTPMVVEIRNLVAKVDETNDINRRILNASY